MIILIQHQLTLQIIKHFYRITVLYQNYQIKLLHLQIVVSIIIKILELNF